MQILCDGAELVSPIQVEVQPESEHLEVNTDLDNQTEEMSIPDYYDSPSIGHVSFSGMVSI